MPPVDNQGVLIGLSAVVVALHDGEPMVLTTGSDAQAGLPFGPFEPSRDRTFELALRTFVTAQTGFELGYVEQLYTFGDRYRDPREREGGARGLSTAYLALVREQVLPQTLPAQWSDWYGFVPWEDWRNGRPQLIDQSLGPQLQRWAGRDRRRRRRVESPEISTFHSLCVRILRRHIDRLGYPKQFAIYGTLPNYQRVLAAGGVSTPAEAAIVAREFMVQAGRPWVDEVYRRLDSRIVIEWAAGDGDKVAAGATVAVLRGPARPLLSGERTALNFLQVFSATATTTARFVEAVSGTRAKILDTRKTIPGLRLAQKYAVRCGGGVNHRFGLYDAILIKENHILGAGGIATAVGEARRLHPGVPVEVEVESIDELRQGLQAGAERLLLDNFSVEQLREAVAVNRKDGDPPAVLEASGNMSLSTVRTVAETGVDYISVGALTKNIEAIDLSMRFGSGM